MNAYDAVGFERSTRPLLELVQRLTGLETSFVTRTDWTAQTQEVVLASNTSVLEVTEGSVLDWSDSMCRRVLLSGQDHTADVRTDFPGSRGGELLGMRSFFTVPILAGEVTVGTLCGASRNKVELSAESMTHMRLIAESLAFQMVSQLEHQRDRQRAEHAETLAMTDSLTGLANHRAFRIRLEEELARSGRHKSPISLLAIDIDSFKSVNDTYGHAGGNDVLCALADVLRTAARAEDVPARLGGDEFAVLLPHTDAAGAAALAARVAKDFRRTTRDLDLPATVSVGVSSSLATARRSLLAAADQALYRCKQRGESTGSDPATTAATRGRASVGTP